MEIALAVVLLAVLAGGAAIMGFAVTRAFKEEKPTKVFIIGLWITFAGVILGYAVVSLVFMLEKPNG